MADRVLIIEDNKMIIDIVEFNLQREGFEVDKALTGTKGLEKALEGKQDIVLLDLMLPGMDGLEVLRRLREHSRVPVIIMTAKESEEDKIQGLEGGADDYIVKPLSVRELVARVKANLRRRAPQGNGQDAAGSVVRGRLRADPSAMSIYKDGDPVDVTAREFDLLIHLMRNAGKPFTREQLLKNVWGFDIGDPRTVDVTVRRLREKIEDQPAAPEIVQTKRGVGYFFAEPTPPSTL